MSYSPELLSGSPASRKRTLVLFLVSLTLPALLTQCNSKNDTQYVTTIVRMASEGLNLQAVTDLATKVKDAQEFEEKLNAFENPINNLDLNEDYKVDYIKITEINEEAQKGFSLTTEVTPGEEQELATIQFEKNGNEVAVQTHGNNQIYGNNHYHHSRFGLSDILIWHYLISPHRGFSSSYRYGASSHRSYTPRAHDNYQKQHQGAPYTKSVTPSKTSITSTPIKSPNYNKSAQSIKAPLRNPTSSQRSFQSRNPSRTLAKNGFGRRSSSSSSSSKSSSKSRSGGFGRSSSFGSSSSSRSGSSFGGGK